MVNKTLDILDLRDELVMIARITIRGKWVIILAQLQQQALKQLHNNQTGNEKT